MLHGLLHPTNVVGRGGMKKMTGKCTTSHKGLSMVLRDGRIGGEI